MAVTHCVSRFPGWMLVSWQCPTPLYLLSNVHAYYHDAREC